MPPEVDCQRRLNIVKKWYNLFRSKTLIPKILSPGGDLIAVKAAILAGADEVYLGVSEFNARRRANNISFEELEELSILARQRGVQLFLTLNTLITNQEFPKIVEVINQAVAAGISAFIVQDLGLLYILHRLLPSMELHGSTQLNTHNQGQIDFWADKGFSRLNLARELSLEEISSLTGHAHSINIETEVFVHGAYCISYSGQCYMSSFMGGKSGNRGICFQPCRRLYDDSHSQNPQFRLNLKDNNQLSNAEALCEAGVDSLKIEGRIKGFFYVYSVTQAWRSRLMSKDPPVNVEKVFNRGFHAGYTENRVGRDMFAQTGPGDQSLEFISEVKSYSAKDRILQTESSATLAQNDKILIYTQENRFICTGVITRVYSSREFSFQIEHELKGKILKGQIILKNSNYQAQKRLQEQIDLLTYEKQTVSVTVTGSLGSPLNTLWRIQDKEISVKSSIPLEEANNAGLSLDTLKKQFSRLDSKFLEIGSINIDKLDKQLFLPVSELNKIRRQALANLFQRPGKTIICPELPDRMDKPQKKTDSIIFYINRSEDFKLLQTLGIQADSIIFEVTDPEAYDHNCPCSPWFPAIIHPSQLTDYYRLVDKIAVTIPLFTDNLAIAHYAGKTGRKWIAGHRLNITNSFAVQSLKESGAQGFILSNELNKTQIESLLNHGSIQSYYTFFAPLFLMESKQCFIKDDKGCRKQLKDDKCFSECRFSSSIYDENKHRYYLEKRPFKENEIYNGPYLYTPEALNDFRAYSTLFIADLRRFGFFDPSENLFTSMVQVLKENQKLNKSELKIPFTRGNYHRGLS